MNPSEITVIVYRAKSLHSKRKNKHKYNVTFGIGNNKAKSDNVDDGDGNPEWNTEAALNIDDHMEALILKVKDKDDILGQITLHMHELPNAKPARPKSVPLQPHKKCPNPQGEVVFEAWISAYSDTEPVINGKSKHKSGKLKKAGSSESINSTVSGFSTMSEATKKKSTLKKLKGAFSHSPKLGNKSKMHSKTSAQSCVDLTSGQLAVQNIDFRESNESLASQTSGISKQSGLEKKSKNPFSKMKSKLGKSPLTGRKSLTLSKKNSSSMHDLAFGGQGFTMANTGSSESIDKMKTLSRMDASFPDKFDLTAPTALMQTLAKREEDERKRKEEEERKRIEQAKKKEDTVSINSGDGIGVSPKTNQRRRLSVQTRSLRDDPRLKKVNTGSPLLGRQIEDTITPVSSNEKIRGPTLGSSHENVSVPPSSSHNSFREKLGSDGDSRSIRSNHSNMSNEYESNTTPFYMNTPPAKKKLTSERPTPEITGISPSQGSIEGGTKLTIRGKNLGLDKADVVCLDICGANCLTNLEYISDRKLQVTTKAWKPGAGKIIVETQSGGREQSLAEFTFIEAPVKHPPSPILPTHKFSSSPPPAVSVFDVMGVNSFADKNTPPTKPKRVQESTPSKDFSSPQNDIYNEEPVAKKSPPPPKPVRVSKSPEVSPRSNNTEPNFESSSKKSPAPKATSPKRDSSPEKRTHSPDRPKVLEEPETRRKIKVSSKDLLNSPLEGQERQEPEGMTEAISHKSPVAKHVDVFAKEKSPGHRSIQSSEGGEGPSQNELMEMIQALQAEKTALQLENASMKGYMEKIIDKVIDRCPDVLCIDPNAPSVK